jgi:hypothetical protein
VYTSGQYIENQNLWTFVGYGSNTMSYNGCGIIAIINAFHSMGIDLTIDQVTYLIADFENYGSVLGGAGGTSPMAIVEYFENNTTYEVTYTTSMESDDIEKMATCCDTYIVEVYNEGDDVTEGMHFVNIEKRVENGVAKFYVHNTSYFYDENGDGIRQDKEQYIESGPYYSLEEAIIDVDHNGNSRPIMVIGITDPIYTDAPEKEEETC